MSQIRIPYETPSVRPYLDLLASSGYTLSAVVVLTMELGLPTAVRILIALPLLLFTPGYALVTAMFPDTATDFELSGAGHSRSEPRSLFDGLVPLERATLAVVSSASVVAITVYALSAVTSITLLAICYSISIVTVSCSAVAVWRRDATEWRERRTSAGLLGNSVRDRLKLEPRLDLLPVIAVLATLVMVGVGGGTVLTDTGGSSANTELYLVTRTDGGNVTASNYQQTFEPGDRATYTVGIEHHYDAPRRYTFVVAVERFTRANDQRVVQSRRILERVSKTVPPEQANLSQIRVAPSEEPGDARVLILLYPGDAPDTPRPETALRTVHLSIEIGAENTTSS